MDRKYQMSFFRVTVTALLAAGIAMLASCGGGGGGGGAAPAPSPSEFTLTGPSNSTAGIYLTPELSWTDSGGETSYIVQISTAANFAGAPVYQDAGIAADTTSVTVPGGILSAGTQYYWRVLAVNSSGQTVASNAPFSFSTMIGVTLPTSFDMTAPANNATGVSLTPTLSWTDAGGETGYTVQISTTANFAGAPVYQDASITAGTTSAAVPAGALNAGTQYYWRVLAVNSSGQTVASNAPFSFSTMIGVTLPTSFDMTAPANNATGVSLTPTLSWTDAGGETGYTVQISTAANFAGAPVYQDTGIAAGTTSTAVPAGALSAGTQYYWRVLALNGAGQTIAANAPASFNTAGTTPPTPFTLTALADNATGAMLSPTLSWTDAGGETSYTVQISTAASFAVTPVYQAAGLAAGTTTITVPGGILSGGTQYYWRVLAVNSAGQTTASNAPFSFTTIAGVSLPSSFALVVPADSATNVSLTPVLTWTDAVGETSYTAQISASSSFNAVIYENALLGPNTTSLSLPGWALSTGTQYYWRVLALNGAGQTTASNAPFSFTTALGLTPPTGFTLTAPADIATSIALSPTLSWTDAGGETNYTVQISTSPAFTAMAYDNNTIPANATSHTVPAGTLNAGSTYYWRVKAGNSVGSTTATNAPFSFATKNSGERVWAQSVDPSAPYDDEIYGVAVDATAVYSVGFDSDTSPKFDDQWRIEKRGLGDGSLITSFGMAGVVVSNPSSTTINSFDDANAIAIDSTYMYVVGYDAIPDVATGASVLTDDEWRIEKRRLDTGALDTSFGSSGVVVLNPSSSIDEANAIAIDSLYMYVAGYDTTATRGKEWRIEKRLLATGAPVTAFGTNGVILSDPSAQADNAKAIAIDGTHMFVAGHESAGSGLFQWRIEKRSLDTGTFDNSFGSSGVVTVPTVTGDSSISAVAVDGQYLYIAGYVTINIGNTAWTIEKRDKSNGTLVYRITSNPNPSGNNAPKAMAIDAAYAYVAGYDTVATQKGWRIEKRDLSDGSLVTSFGVNGVYQSHPSAALDDDIWAMASDAAYLYVAGYDMVPGTREWRIEKIVK